MMDMQGLLCGLKYIGIGKNKTDQPNMLLPLVMDDI